MMPADPPGPAFSDAQLTFLQLIFPHLWRDFVAAMQLGVPGAVAALGQGAAAIIARGRELIANVRAGTVVTDRNDGIGTVSVIEVAGTVFVGLNGTNYADDSAERLETQAFQKRVFPKLKGPRNQPLYHAEAQSLLRLAAALGDDMPGELVLHVDRKTCGQCIAFLPKLCQKLGIRRLTIIVAGDRCGVLMDGVWTWVSSDAEMDAHDDAAMDAEGE